VVVEPDGEEQPAEQLAVAMLSWTVPDPRSPRRSPGRPISTHVPSSDHEPGSEAFHDVNLDLPAATCVGALADQCPSRESGAAREDDDKEVLREGA